MAGKLLVLISCPRAGKSFFANNWQKEISDKPKVVVNPDLVRIAFFNEQFSPKQLYEPLDSIVRLITEIMVKTLYNSGYFVCVDAVNCFEGDIIKWLKIDKEAEFKYIDTPLEECLERGRQTGVDLDGIIRAVHGSLQELAWLSKDKWDTPPQTYASSDLYLPLEERIYKSIELLREKIK